VIVPDANLLLYAYNTTDRQHTIARNWLDGVMNGRESIGLCWPVVLAFLRVGTSRKVFLQPLQMTEAVEIVNEWVTHPHVIMLAPTDRHWVILSKILVESQVRGGMTTDAEIAAYVIEHGGTLYTADRDFARFPGLNLINPLGA
jgi:uncharacterized protein